MNKELYMVFLPALSWILFALGGTQITPKLGGFKWLRRFVLPAVYFLFVLLAGFSLWSACGVTILAIACFCLGYGNGKSWFYRFLVGCAYACISIPIGFGFWNIMTATIFIVFFALSNWDYSAEEFTWKICEGFYGLFIGIQIAFLLM